MYRPSPTSERGDLAHAYRVGPALDRDHRHSVVSEIRPPCALAGVALTTASPQVRVAALDDA